VIMNAEYDYLTNPEEGQTTAEQIKGAEFIEMKAIGHFPMSENYPVFKEYLQQALQLIDGRAGAPVGGAQQGTQGRDQQGEENKGLLDRAKEKLT